MVFSVLVLSPVTAVRKGSPVGAGIRQRPGRFQYEFAIN